ncbi:MAG: hypothetical protein ABSF97_06350 [Candidatus Sulfotelmatobacter sp.]|jgi:hypothetical protein
MAIDLVALDAKIRKLQMVRQLASDPDVASLLSDIVSGNGVAGQTPTERKDAVRYDVLKFVAGPSEIGQANQDRTAKQITEMMERAKYDFNSKNHSDTVRESLRNLVKEGLVEKVGINPEDGAALWRKTTI